MWSRRVGKGQKVKDSLDSGKEPGERGGTLRSKELEKVETSDV